MVHKQDINVSHSQGKISLEVTTSLSFHILALLSLWAPKVTLKNHNDLGVNRHTIQARPSLSQMFEHLEEGAFCNEISKWSP